ncbi:Nucleotide-diphospho-sugar transferase domain-containing protein [Caenorhabditis elegans]|uniref:Nucleotide-diphospho-sugar transferase domain-containing protein n=1 Tax=Caenorhabditis elegans TaxID=6239 RepID=Q20581_CAEEL|nr:Nucleotide-diphospho-sugar transferase domain-containing protein [Caenorhabditis elegans]CAA92508.3 Nucleotide-diphospho-sugar transferase domain-containing protein [Caenorhabditis elegans]|eukprot:NP_501625.3 Uncharacterized protein CELE_F49C12.3 [Caenorhabditis elegans]
MTKISNFLVPSLHIYFIYILYTKSLYQGDGKMYKRKAYLQNLLSYSKEITFDTANAGVEFNAFANILKKMPKTPYVILFDSSNIDVLYNHICNLKFIPNAVSRIVAIAFDKDAHLKLHEKYPNIPNILIDLTPLKKSIEAVQENREYLTYGLVLMVRARICAHLAQRGVNFWLMQQDTIWTENLQMSYLEEKYPEAHLILDRIGNEMPFFYRMQMWACGATFFVRGSPTTYQYFKQVESYMFTDQSPDSTIMTYLCGHNGYKCEFLSYSVASSSNYFETLREYVPALIQLDGEKKDKETKMDTLTRGKFNFQFKNGTCNEKAYMNAKQSAKTAYLDAIGRWPVPPESQYLKIQFFLGNLFNVDPWNRKAFMKYHYSLLQ